ncbi:MAG: cation diffusion facilitator family transporter [Acidobacteriota bacterium]
MAHTHPGGAHHHHDPAESGRLSWALVLTGSFMLVEAVGGWLTGSLALLADAGHMLSDTGALAVALMASRWANRPPDARQTMGYQRAEVLAAGLNAGALVVLAAWIMVEALGRLGQPSEVLAGPMLVVALIGLMVNLGIAGMLSGHTHSLNTRAALLHVLGDALGSVGALVAGSLILWRGWNWADPAASILIATVICWGASRVLREVISVLMQAAPENVDVPRLEQEILEVDGVESVHALNVWTLRPGEDVITVHVVIRKGMPAETVSDGVRQLLTKLHPGAHVTVQPEPSAAICR